MSCFVMQPESIAAISEFAADLLNHGLERYGFEAPKELAKALPNCRDPYCFFDAKKIYERLYALNVAAYEGHYGQDISNLVPDIKTDDYRIHRINHDTPRRACVWHYHMAKLLKCYNYQVLEDATIKHPLTLGLKGLEHSLDEFIVTHSHEYEQAPSWGRLHPVYEESYQSLDSQGQEPRLEEEELEP